MFDEQRCFEIRDGDLARVGEPGVEIAELQRLPAVEQAGELDVHLTPPLRPRALLFVDRNAFSEPAWDALIRHLERNDVCQLVPQRRLPLEAAGRPCLRRVERDDPPETRAEGAD